MSINKFLMSIVVCTATLTSVSMSYGTEDHQDMDTSNMVTTPQTMNLTPQTSSNFNTPKRETDAGSNALGLSPEMTSRVDAKLLGVIEEFKPFRKLIFPSLPNGESYSKEIADLVCQGALKLLELFKAECLSRFELEQQIKKLLDDATKAKEDANAELAAEREKLAAEREKLAAEREKLAAELAAEREKLAAEREKTQSALEEAEKWKKWTIWGVVISGVVAPFVWQNVLKEIISTFLSLI